jgi:diguanylate cyclase (GGDEF)-like protein
VEPNVQAVDDTFEVDVERRAVEDECIRTVCLQPLRYAVCGPLGGLLLVAVLFGQVAHRSAIGWLAALVVTRAIVRVLAVMYGRVASAGSRLRRWSYLASEVAQGTIWALAPYLLHVRQQRYEVFLIVTLMAVMTMSSLTMAPFLTAALAFTAPVGLLLTAWLMAEGGQWGFGAAVGTITIYLTGISHAYFTNAGLKKAVAGRREVARLAAQLELARARAEAANAELQARNDRLREIARRDPLTGLYNRRHFVEWLDRVRVRDAATRPWFLAILDADHFKRFNDEFGHQVGDQVLMSIANAAGGEIRWTDCFARIGGEEFGLLLQDVSYEEAVAIVERVRAAVGAVDLGVGAITLSVGMLAGEQNMEAAIALARADEALYEAKRTGRDRLVCDPPAKVEAKAGTKVTAKVGGS